MMNYEEQKPEQKKEFWSNHIRHFRKSGLSQKKYCEQKNLSYWSFRTWYYKIIPEASESRFIRVNSFKPEERASKIRIILSGRIRIELDEDISEEILQRIFKASEVLND